MHEHTDNEYTYDTYNYWISAIEKANKWREPYIERGRKIISRYRDERGLYASNQKYNILYSNTETLQPVIYNDRPKVDARARNFKNVASRKASKLLEDAVQFYIDNDDFNNKANQMVLDYLLAGTGLMRPVYEAYMQDVESDDGVEKQVVYENLKYEYVNWEDFIYPKCAKWDDLPWLAFRGFMDKGEATNLFGKENAERLSYTKIEKDKSKKDYSHEEAEGRACVYEIWDKTTKQRVFVAETLDKVPCLIDDDPLELEGFFPVPKPLLSITTTDTLLPVPFFVMYQDQANELDNVCDRLHNMVAAMKRRGFYDSSIDSVGQISDLGDNEFAPVNNWLEVQQRGGMKAAMETEDLTSYVQTIGVLQNRKLELIDDIYQIIGISDIRRGQTDPRETLGAQRIKSRYGTIRVSTYQRQVENYFRDLLKITAEIIANRFDARTIHLVTGHPEESVYKKGENGERQIETVGVKDLLVELRERSPVEYVVNVQTDSTVLEDVEEDKADLLDMTNALIQLMQVAPTLIQVIGEEASEKLLLSYIGKFKLGRGIQQEIMNHLENLKKQPPEQPQPTEAQLESEKAKLNAQVEGQKLAVQAQLKAAELQLKQQELQLKAAELGLKEKVEFEKLDIEAINTAIKAVGLKAEQANPNDNAIVGS